MATRPDQLSRRKMLQTGAAAVAATAVGGVAARGAEQCPSAAEGRAITKGRIKQTVHHWCYEPMPLETLARHAAAMGMTAMEGIPPKDWGVLKRYGLICAMTHRPPVHRGPEPQRKPSHVHREAEGRH